MSDYFDHVEQGLRNAVAQRAHMPWYVRLRLRPSRPAAVAVACLIATGSALAATGAFRTGEPIGPEVPGTPAANEGVPIPASVSLLSLRVPDPAGGPPWGLRELRTTRGLMCLQVGSRRRAHRGARPLRRLRRRWGIPSLLPHVHGGPRMRH